MCTYTEAPRQAHSRMRESGQPALSESEIEEFARFLQQSQSEGSYGIKEANSEAITMARKLISMLKTDLEFDEIVFSTIDEGWDMEVTFSMVRRADNRYYQLWFWWSVD